MTKAAASTFTDRSSDTPMKTTDNIPGWVSEMHQHYRVNGFYRAVDLHRVLGDPTASVKGTATAGAPSNRGDKK